MKTTSGEQAKKTVIQDLIKTNCIKQGLFTLKNGTQSNIYVNMRDATMYNPLFKNVKSLVKATLEKALTIDHDGTKSSLQQVAVIGVPYGVVPMAAVVADACDLLYYPVRKETKAYGYKEQDETLFNDFRFILIEDVMSSGSSIIETIDKLGSKKVTDVIVIVDRESGGEQSLKAKFPEIQVHSIIKLSEINEYMKNN